MKIFDAPPKTPIRVGHPTFFKALLRMAKAWEKLAVHNGHVDWSNGMPTIVVDAAEANGGLAYDYVIVGRSKAVPPTRTTNFLKVFHDGSTPEWVEAMPETQDADATVYDVTKNRIYLPGEVAG